MALQGRHMVRADRSRALRHRVRRSNLRPHLEEFALDAGKQLVHVGAEGFGPHQAQHRVQFVHRAVGFYPRHIFVDPRPAEEHGLALVARPGVDPHGYLLSRQGWPNRSWVSRLFVAWAGPHVIGYAHIAGAAVGNAQLAGHDVLGDDGPANALA